MVDSFEGAFGRDLGAPRLILGWEDIQNLAAGEALMGEWPDEESATQPGRIVLMSLEPFATNAADRPDIHVEFSGASVSLIRKKPLFAAGAAVLNHPFWIGIFEGPCQFDMVNEG